MFYFDIGVFSVLFGVVVFGLVKWTKGNSGPGPSSALSSQRPTGQPSTRISEAPKNVTGTSEGPFRCESKQGDAPVEWVDCTGFEMPDPERDAGQTDSVLIDMIRQGIELPSAILEISSMLNDPEAGAKKIADTVSTDPVLSSHILRVANSPAFAGSNIKSIAQAIVYLGFNTVALIVTQSITAKSMKPFAKIGKDKLRELWLHSSAVSVFTRHLLFRFDLNTSGFAPMVYTAALLHDIGKFLLWALKAPESCPSLQEARPPTLEEKNTYGVDHARVGFLLSTYWKLPADLCSTIAFHHHPCFGNIEDIPSYVREPVFVLALANFLANVAGYSAGMERFEKPHSAICEHFKLNKSIEGLITKDIQQELKRMEGIISV